MVQPRFNFGSTSKTLNISLLPFNERSEFQNLAFQVKTPSFFYYYNFFLGAVLGSLCLRRKFGLWRLEFHLLIYIDWTLNSKISLDTSTLLIFFISLISLEFWYMEWNLAWTQWDGRTLRMVLTLENMC